MKQNNIPQYGFFTTDDLFSGIQQLIRNYMNSYICTCQIVEVTGYTDGDNRFVDVKPVIQDKTTSGETVPITENDIIYGVPMLTLFGNKCEISLLVEPGDKGILIAMKSDISTYKKTREIKPKPTFRAFDFSDGVFIPLDFKTRAEGVMVRNGNTKIHLFPERIDIISTNTINMTAADTINVNCPTLNANVTSANIEASGNITAAAGGAVTVSAPSVSIGENITLAGGTRGGVACVGDSVAVNFATAAPSGTYTGRITSGASAGSSITVEITGGSISGTATGTITSGSETVRA